MGRLGFQPSGRAAELADEAYGVCILDAPPTGTAGTTACTRSGLGNPADRGVSIRLRQVQHQDQYPRGVRRAARQPLTNQPRL